MLLNDQLHPRTAEQAAAHFEIPSVIIPTVNDNRAAVAHGQFEGLKALFRPAPVFFTPDDDIFRPGEFLMFGSPLTPRSQPLTQPANKPRSRLEERKHRGRRRERLPPQRLLLRVPKKGVLAAQPGLRDGRKNR